MDFSYFSMNFIGFSSWHSHFGDAHFPFAPPRLLLWLPRRRVLVSRPGHVEPGRLSLAHPKNHGLKVSWDDKIPNWMESHKSHVPVTTNQFWYLNPFMGIRTNPNKNTKPTKPPEHQKAPQLRQAAAEAHNSRCSSTDRDHFAGAPDHLTSPHRDGGFLNSSYFGWRF